MRELGAAPFQGRRDAYAGVRGRERRREVVVLCVECRRKRQLRALSDRALGGTHGDGQAIGELGGPLERLARRHGRAHKPDPVCFGGRHEPIEQDELGRPRVSDAPRQPLRSAGTGHHASADLWEAELRPPSGDRKVQACANSRPPPTAEPSTAAITGWLERRECVESPPREPDVGGHPCRTVERFAKLAYIRPGRERAAASAGENHGAHPRVGTEP